MTAQGCHTLHWLFKWSGLFAAKRDQWIDLHRPACRHVGGKCRDSHKCQEDDGEDDGIVRLYTEQKAREHPYGYIGGSNADGGADQGNSDTLHHDQVSNASRILSESEANAY